LLALWLFEFRKRIPFVMMQHVYDFCPIQAPSSTFQRSVPQEIVDEH